MSDAREVRTIVVTSAALSTAVLPVFLIGALSDAIRTDLGLGEAGIGAAITVLLGTAGLTATLAGRVTDRIGARPALRIGVALAGLATASVGAFAQRWWHIAVAFAVAGMAVGLIDTGAARTFAERVRDGRHGTAFGVKEASVPGASLLAGVALPTVGVWLGWRWTFVAAIVVAILVSVALPRRSQGEASSSPEVVTVAVAAESRSAVVALALAVGIGAGAANAAATFLAPAATASGATAAVAGLVLALASLASIVVRVVAGRWADPPERRAGALIAILSGLGAGGAAALALAHSPGVLLFIGGLVVLGAGWGWTGLAFLAAVRARPHAPAAAAGTVLAGIGLGGALGPLGFGALVEVGSYQGAWAATAVAMLIAAVLAMVSERSRAAASAPAA